MDQEEPEPTVQSQDEQGTEVTWPSPPTFDFGKDPASIAVIDLGDLPSGVRHSFVRSARWCSDGTAILTSAEDRVLRLWDISDDGSIGSGAGPRSFAQPDAIHATNWWPSASRASAEMFCFMASIRDSPVRLIDAADGRIRGTYSIIDHRERFIAPHSLAFNPAATKVYCGHENAIEVLDIANPGNDTSERLKTSFSRNEKGGQKGIFSALAFAPDYSGLYAAGSFAGSVSLYTEDTGATPVQYLEGVLGGGVTQIAFHPLAPHIVILASRRSTHIQIFDTRVTSAAVSSLSRASDTNQRLHFDVDPWGRFLAAGDTHGTVKVWDMSDLSKDEPIFDRKLHNDAVGSVQLHPFKPLLLTSAGSRSFLNQTTDDDESSDEDSASNVDDTSSNASHFDGGHITTPPQYDESSGPVDRSICVWSFAPAS